MSEESCALCGTHTCFLPAATKSLTGTLLPCRCLNNHLPFSMCSYLQGDHSWPPPHNSRDPTGVLGFPFSLPCSTVSLCDSPPAACGARAVGSLPAPSLEGSLAFQRPPCAFPPSVYPSAHPAHCVPLSLLF